MNLTPTEADAWFRAFVPLVADLADRELFVLPPFTAISVARERLRGTPIAWGAQDVHPDDDGAAHRRRVGPDAGRPRLPLRRGRSLASGAATTARRPR